MHLSPLKVAGPSTGPPQRSANPSFDDRYPIVRLLSPRDEAIDLDEPAWAAALAATSKAWKPDPTKQENGVLQKEPELPNGPVIVAYEAKVRGLD